MNFKVGDKVRIKTLVEVQKLGYTYDNINYDLIKRCGGKYYEITSVNRIGKIMLKKRNEISTIGIASQHTDILDKKYKFELPDKLFRI